MSATFRAMNTDVAVVAPTLDETCERDLAGEVAAVFERSERVFSRFRPESELSHLNAAGVPTVVSTELFAALARARHYWALTDGWFDPTVGAALAAAGYDRSFAPGALDRPTEPRRVGTAGRFGDVRLDERTRSVTLPRGVQVDCGGFVKGWTVDRAARMLPVPAALDAGGDAVLRGHGVDGRGWLVDIEDPNCPGRALFTLSLADRAVATSGRNRRRWRMGAIEQHHLIDPWTGRPSSSDLVQVTVTAPTAELADVLAKVAFLRGLADGMRFLERFDDLGAVFVDRDGRVRLVGELEVADVAA